MPTILVVEDDPVILVLWKELLEEESYLVLSAASSQQALRMARLAEARPQLMILDYMMAGLNGIQLYDQLCHSFAWQDIPALMVSADLPVKEVAARGLRGIHKPFDLYEVLDLIASLLFH